MHIAMNNLLEIHEKSIERYSLSNIFRAKSEPEDSIVDEFMLRVNQILAENMDDDEFDISQLCLQLAISKTQLYRKFSMMSNITIAKYFKTIRLRKAKNLFSTTQMNVTEVTFAAGFKNLSYFSREFSREFGKSPSEYKRENRLNHNKKK